jgi:hypothetical protein
MAEWFRQIERAIRHTGQDIPDCISGNMGSCTDCLLGDPGVCPLLGDPEAFAYLRWLHDRTVAYERARAKRIAILCAILGSHGLPLHWEVLAKIAMSESPSIFASADSVKQTLFLNGAQFRYVGQGIFELAVHGEPMREGPPGG